jgi:tRNA(Ile)-lysidine synthase TilS/MesJ
LNLNNVTLKDQISNEKKDWICPCNGCKKARKQAFDEIMKVIDAGGDAYTKIHNIKKLISEK